jgi:hypothetical protein
MWSCGRSAGCIRSSAAVAASASTHRAQYFLVSPKLLEGLAAMDNDDVTVLMVYNGPGITSKWQLGDIIMALRKRKASLISSDGGGRATLMHAADDEEDEEY